MSFRHNELVRIEEVDSTIFEVPESSTSIPQHKESDLITDKNNSTKIVGLQSLNELNEEEDDEENEDVEQGLMDDRDVLLNPKNSMLS